MFISYRKSNFFRTVFSVAVFTVTLGAFKHLLFACLMAVAAQAMGVFLFNLDVIHALDGVDWTFTKGKVTKLFKIRDFYSSLYSWIFTFSLVQNMPLTPDEQCGIGIF